MIITCFKMLQTLMGPLFGPFVFIFAFFICPMTYGFLWLVVLGLPIFLIGSFEYFMLNTVGRAIFARINSIPLIGKVITFGLSSVVAISIIALNLIYIEISVLFLVPFLMGNH